MTATGLLETSALRAAAALSSTRETRDFAAGLGLTAAVPATFWTATYAGLAGVLGYETSTGHLAVVAIGIASFLALVFTTLSARSSSN